MMDMSGKVVIVTGGNAGIGFESAKAMAIKGAKVVIATRSEERGTAAVKKIQTDVGGGDVLFMKLDLASLTSVRAFVDAFKAKNWPLHVLVNNAGISNVRFAQTEEKFEVTIGTNYVGHFVLTMMLLNVLKASAPARVVTVSSKAADIGTIDWNDITGRNFRNSGFGCYCKSKLYNYLFAMELERRLEGSGVHSFVCHPGIAKTEIYGKMSKNAANRMLSILKGIFATPAEKGALPTLFCSTAEAVEGEGGLSMGPGVFGFRGKQDEWKCFARGANDPDVQKKLFEQTANIVGLTA